MSDSDLPYMVSWVYRSTPSEVLLGKDVPKICIKFTGEHPCRSNDFNKIAKQLY